MSELPTAVTDPLRLLHSVVGLTENSDIRDFEQALLRALGGSIRAGGIRLCRIRDRREQPGKSVVYLEPMGAEPSRLAQEIPLDNEPGFAECLRTEAPVNVNDAQGNRTVYPLRAGNGVAGFLVIEPGQLGSADQELVGIMLRFHTNYVSLLNESQRDKLTGLHNRAVFHERMMTIISSCRAAPAPEPEPQPSVRYCLALLDIDHFKRVNDRFGHLYGDEVLLLFSQALVQSFRGGDLLFRFGGEEFVIVLKNVDLGCAVTVCERFRLEIEALSFPQVGQVTTSIGISCILGSDMPASVIDRADQALYFAKNSGRNRVCAYETLIAEGKLSNAKREGDAELF